MITIVHSNCRYVFVSQNPQTAPYINVGNSASDSAGTLRWNPNTHGLDINDGFGWTSLDTNHTNIGLSAEAVELLDWVRQKRDEEEKIQALAEKYPALKKAKDNYDMILNLTKNHCEETE